jgi:hypothetical protein
MCLNGVVKVKVVKFMKACRGMRLYPLALLPLGPED